MGGRNKPAMETIWDRRIVHGNILHFNQDKDKCPFCTVPNGDVTCIIHRVDDLVLLKLLDVDLAKTLFIKISVKMGLLNKNNKDLIKELRLYVQCKEFIVGFFQVHKWTKNVLYFNRDTWHTIHMRITDRTSQFT